MPLVASDYQTAGGDNPPGTLSNFNPGEYGDTYNVPFQPQEDTYTVTTGAADTGWIVLVVNDTTGAQATFTFDPVDAAGAASATTADAAASMARVWNANVSALEFGRATVVAAVVTIVYNDDRTSYTLTVTEQGLGAGTVATPVTNSVIGLEVGIFAFRPTDAAIGAGADPRSLVTPTAAVLEQFVGGLARNDSTVNPSFETNRPYPTYSRGQNVPVARRAVMAIRAAVAVTVLSPVSAVVGAGAGERDGWLTTGAGLVLTSGVRVYRGAPANGVALVEFTLA